MSEKDAGRDTESLEEVIERVESERLITHTNDEHSKVMATAVRKHYEDNLKCAFCNKEGLTLSELAGHLWDCEEFFTETMKGREEQADEDS